MTSLFKTPIRSIQRHGISAAVYVLLLLVVVYPIGRLFLSAFQTSRPGKESIWTLVNFSSLLSSRAFVDALKNTILISVEAVLISTALGVLLAWAIARTDMPFKKFLEPLNMIPFYLSNLVIALSWEMLAAPKTGILNRLMISLFDLGAPPFNIYSITGISMVVGLAYTPYVYLLTVGSLQNMDPALEDAARMSGASTVRTMLKITLPLAAPAILSSMILVFILTAGIFGVPMVLGTSVRVNTVSTQIYNQINLYPPSYNGAAALSSVLLIFTVFLVFVQHKILGRRRFYTVTGKGFRPRLIVLGRWRWAALGINLIYLGVILMPFMTMITISFLPGWTGEIKLSQFGLDNYRTVLFVNAITQRGFGNSVIISLLGATLGLGIFALLAAMIHRTKLPGRSGISFVAMLPVTFPGIVLGTGFLIAWISTPLYGTLWILMLAYIVAFMPVGVRSMEASLGSIAPDLDESARVSGARWFGALRRILLPLMWPGLVSTWLLLFVTFMREVSSSMMLYVFGTETISIALIGIMQYETLGASAAFGGLQTLIILFAVFFFRKLSSMGGIGVASTQKARQTIEPGLG